VKRREFITLLGSAAAAWPLTTRAQQSMLPVIGYLSNTSLALISVQLAGFRQGLKEAGYVEGQNVRIEYRWAEGQYDRLPALARDLVGRRLAVIFAGGGVAPVLAAKAATSTIPIVFQMGSDPVKAGVVASLNHPGGNVTGVSRMSTAMLPKELELLRELVPTASVIQFLVNPTNPIAEIQLLEMQEAVRSLGIELQVLRASSEGEIDGAFEILAQIPALVIANDPFFSARHAQIAELTARHKVPAIFSQRDFALSGGLMSYSASLTDSHRQAGVYVGRILKGEKPADLPIVQPTKFELVINLKTATTLGLTIPPGVLAIADEVIE
jgi:putative tryptophan/tyrosine transport system substrate-binding protein